MRKPIAYKCPGCGKALVKKDAGAVQDYDRWDLSPRVVFKAGVGAYEAHRAICPCGHVLVLMSGRVK